MVIDTVFALAGQTLPDETKLYLSTIWTEQLASAIPSDRLGDCLNRAITVHQGRSAVNAYELLDAWKYLSGEGIVDFSGCDRCDEYGMFAEIIDGVMRNRKCSHQR